MLSDLENKLKLANLALSEQVQISTEKSFKKQISPTEIVLVSRNMRKINKRSRE